MMYGLGSPLAIARDLIPDPKRRAVLRPRLAPVVEARGGDVGVAKPFLHLGDVSLVRERIRGRRGAQRVHAQPVYLGADAGLKAVFSHDVAVDGAGIERPVEIARAVIVDRTEDGTGASAPWPASAR